jgi:hypothetical protein
MPTAAMQNIFSTVGHDTGRGRRHGRGVDQTGRRHCKRGNSGRRCVNGRLVLVANGAGMRRRLTFYTDLITAVTLYKIGHLSSGSGSASATAANAARSTMCNCPSCHCAVFRSRNRPSVLFVWTSDMPKASARSCCRNGKGTVLPLASFLPSPTASRRFSIRRKAQATRWAASR